jgi:hypothetical protein
LITSLAGDDLVVVKVECFSFCIHKYILLGKSAWTCKPNTQVRGTVARSAEGKNSLLFLSP